MVFGSSRILELEKNLIQSPLSKQDKFLCNEKREENLNCSLSETPQNLIAEKKVSCITFFKWVSAGLRWLGNNLQYAYSRLEFQNPH